ncbi:MAG: D-alanyl-D-alanine carboxypeptidase family protein [Nitriliruptoraceae bacterium]
MRLANRPHARPVRLLVAVLAALLVAAPGTAIAALEPGPTPLIEAPQPGWPRAIGVEAAAYLVLDLDTGQVLAERDADVRRPVASTIKVLTALTALERTDLDDEVTVGDEVLDVPGSGVGLQPGDTWTVEELVAGLIARSGNEAAEAIAVHVAGSRDAFLRLMEQDAAAIGVEGLELVSVSGLDDGNLLSARDLALLSAAGLAHPELGPILAREVVTIPGQGAQLTRNELLRSYPDATGVKTGFTDAAGYSLVGSAARDGREVVAVVLGAGPDPERFTIAARLLDLGLDTYEPRTLNARIRFAVAGGRIDVVVADTEVVVPVGLQALVELPVAARPPEADLHVPVRVGEQEVARVPATIDRSGAPAPVEDGTAAIGRAAVDGIYAALRARAATQDLGS